MKNITNRFSFHYLHESKQLIESLKKIIIWKKTTLGPYDGGIRSNDVISKYSVLSNELVIIYMM